MKVIKRPMVVALSALAVIGMISFMSFSNSAALGDVAPVTLNKYSAENQNSFKIQNEDQKVVEPEQESEPEPGVIRRPKHKDNKHSTSSSSGNLKAAADGEVEDGTPSVGDFTETPFMPKMANETLKAQLGNASWRLFHTILARYPDAPSAQEQQTLQQYIHLFAQVYPCGDCARHFQKLLAKYPPQTKSRKNAALWGCDIHNKVNERLSKPEYDCTKILEDYDCGCGSDEKEADHTLGNESMDHLRNVEVSNEGKQRG